MKAFSEIAEVKDIITWDLLDFIQSAEKYTAQELKDLESMIYVCMQEVKAWDEKLTTEYFEIFAEKFFDKESEKDMDALSRIISTNYYAIDLQNKLKIAKYYSYLRVPDCFLN